MSLIRVIKDSFVLLAEQPKLFIPKLIVAALYSVPILFLPKIAIDSFTAPNPGLFDLLLFYLFFTIFSSVVDVSVNAFYPFFVKEYRKKKTVSFGNAWKEFRKRAKVIIPSTLLIEFFAFVVLFLLAMPISVSLFIHNDLLFVFFVMLSLVFIIAIAVLFFLIYPVVSLEKKGIFGSIARSINLSLSNLKNVSSIALFSFAFSLLTFAISFMIEFSSDLFSKGTFLVVFIILRVLVSVVATYQYILNPVFYMECIER